MKAIEKDRARRYETAASLAADVRRFLGGEPVHAAPPSWSYRTGKFMRRHKGAVLAALVVLVSLVTGMTAFAWQAMKANEQAEQLKQILEMQESVYEQVDPAGLGKVLSEHVLGRFARVLTESELGEAELEAELKRFQLDWQRINATDAALQVVAQAVLQPNVDALDSRLTDRPELDAVLRLAIARRYKWLGFNAENHSLVSQAAELRMAALGPEHPATLEALSEVAESFLYNYDLDHAEPLYRSILEKQRRVLGEADLRTLTTEHNLAFLMSGRGYPEESETLTRDVLAKRRATLGEMHPETLAAESSLGIFLRDQGRLEAAESLVRQVLDKQIAALGREHPFILMAQRQLAVTLYGRGKLGEAELLTREVLEENRRRYGDEHPDTVWALANLGEVLLEAGELVEAETLIRQGWKLRIRMYGDDSGPALMSRIALARLLNEQQQYQQAVDILSPIESGLRTHFQGNRRFHIGEAQTQFGRALTGLQEWPRAETRLKRASNILTSTPSPVASLPLRCAEALLSLYSSWQAKDPDPQRAAQIEVWRQKLVDLSRQSSG